MNDVELCIPSFSTFLIRPAKLQSSYRLESRALSPIPTLMGIQGLDRVQKRSALDGFMRDEFIVRACIKHGYSSKRSASSDDIDIDCVSFVVPADIFFVGLVSEGPISDDDQALHHLTTKTNKPVET